MQKNVNKKLIRKIAIYIVLLIGVYVMLVPFIWMILTSFKTFKESMTLPIKWLPNKFNIENYKTVLSMNLGRYYLNSIIVTVVITVSQLVVGSMAAYSFARLDFPGRDVLFILVLAMLMVPSQLTLIPKYSMCNNLGLVNTLGGIIAPNMFSVTATFFIRQAFLTLPMELEDAARIDGCSRFRFYWQIAVPLSKAIFVAMGILVALYAWNDLLWPIIVTHSDSTRTLPVFISALKGEHTDKTPILLAAGVLSIMPMITAFIIGQRYFIQAITTTGIKE